MRAGYRQWHRAGGPATGFEKGIRAITEEATKSQRNRALPLPEDLPEPRAYYHGEFFPDNGTVIRFTLKGRSWNWNKILAKM